jgi:hypothetical protein
LFVDPLACDTTTPTIEGIGCSWPLAFSSLANPPANLSLSTGYASGELANLQADLSSPNSFSNTGATPLNASNSVITSVDLEPVDGFYAASYVQNPALAGQPGGFDLSQQTVDPGDLAAAAAQEGARSRVITAVGFNAGQVVYFSYGWQGDTTTLYETSVVAATSETMATAAAGLAANGYIITAIGGSNVADSYVLIGTRVQGDTMARPFVAALSSATGAQLYQPGYAIVGVVWPPQAPNTTYLGER